MLGTYNFFPQLEPVKWRPNQGKRTNTEKIVYSTRGDHGIRSGYILHNLGDDINRGLPDMDRMLIEYRVGDLQYPLATVHDVFDSPYAFDERSTGNIRGILAERIARRVMKRFLQRQDGRIGGIFTSDFDPRSKEQYIVANTQDLVLKIKNYPNMIILRKTGEGHYGYQEVKEIDGLFDYRQARHRNILVLESKVEGIHIDRELLSSNLFSPLRELFPEASFSYVLFGQKSTLYNKTDGRIRRLKQTAVTLHEHLKREGVGTLFFTFNEDEEDFRRMAAHLMEQKRIIGKEPVAFKGTVRLTESQILLFNGGEDPLMRLVRDPANPRGWLEADKV